MDFNKKKVRLGIETLEARDVPALLGPVVALPYPAAPAAEVALTAPHDLGQDVEVSIKIDRSDLKPDQSHGGQTSDSANALKVSMQDIHFTQTVNKHSPKLFLSDLKPDHTQEPTSDSVNALKVSMQDFHFTRTVSKHTPTLG